ncbi:MAG: hypothetical protein ACXWKP_32850 [Bradyrhizobium sp.]
MADLHPVHGADLGRPVFGVGCVAVYVPAGLVLLVPIVLAVHQIAQGSDAFARSLNQLQESEIPAPLWLVRLPIGGEYLDRWWRATLSNPQVLVEWLRGVNVENITSWTSTLGGALLHRLFLFVITLIALFRYFATAHGWRTAQCPLPAGCSEIPASAWSEK